MLKGKTVAALTLGCKVNQYETDGMLALLADAGAKIVGFEEPADIYLINTCSVTNMADKKSRQMLHRARKHNPDAVVVAVGCYAQAAGEELEKDGQVQLIVGNNKKKDIAKILNEYFDPLEESHITNQNDISAAQGGFGSQTSKNILDIAHVSEYETLIVPKTYGHTRAYIKIQDGCNQFCSYCIIPYVRGRIRSRELSSICSEVEQLAGRGVKEIVLTGIHISSYGKDMENGSGLIDVIENISKIESIKRIRLGSLEPGIITPDFVKQIAANPKVCPHFHLSLQSGCDTVLARMNRKYTCRDYFEKCELLRSAYDRPALTTDVIVGFPGETDEEFQTTVSYLERLNLYEMHVFKYSKRQKTAAAAMPAQVSPKLKAERSDVLLAMSNRQKRAYEASFADETLQVLVEEKTEKEGALYYRGHTERYLDVWVPEKRMHEICGRTDDIINQIIAVPGLARKNLPFG